MGVVGRHFRLVGARNLRFWKRILFEIIEAITLLRVSRWRLEEGPNSVTWWKGATEGTSMHGPRSDLRILRGRTANRSDWLGAGRHKSAIRMPFTARV